MDHHAERPMTVRVPFDDPATLWPEAGAHARRHASCRRAVTRHIDNAMVKALARAFRWRHFLESGTYGTIDEIAKAEKINPFYVS
jgi:hypothetical protein